ncbi:MAG TPA: matrixin family metalloprotease, partial [Actinomycetes bacterium]|nr:matrixin family metalloprotease [Actinomycetes bacterium]
PGPAAAAVRLHGPPPGIDEATGPLGVPQPAPPGQGGFAFEATQADGRAPVTWDPCRPIRYVVHGTAPAGAERVVESAIAEVSAASGMVFMPVGLTDELPVTGRSPYQPERYGDRWAPLVIAWSDPARTSELAGNVIGLGGGISAGWDSGHRTYVSGAVWLDGPQFAEDLAHRPASERVLHAVVMHELGHALGLDHVDDPTQVMYPEARLQVTRLGDGDRRGLAALWQGRCAPGL